MNKEYDLIVYIGRFQPFHNGHKATIERASELADNVLVLIGSANGPRTIRNPWTYQERSDAIYENVQSVNLFDAGLDDFSYNDNKWIAQVGKKVQQIVSLILHNQTENEVKELKNTPVRIAVIGHDKDHSSYYLNYFPQWDFVEMSAYPSESDTIDSTKIRQLMFTGQVSFTDGVMPSPQVRNFLSTWDFEQLQEEWDYIEDYKKSWKSAPYDPTFTTVDAVVEQSGHILLIQRGRFPGKGLWAMPGGFLDPCERIKDGAIRELREETKLKVPEKVLRGSITHQEVFDDVNRSLRGRTITHTFLFQLDNASSLPKVKGNDDAADAKWVSLAEFEKMQSVMFEDHYSIIKNMLSRA